jgi:hypothetical protein
LETQHALLNIINLFAVFDEKNNTLKVKKQIVFPQHRQILDQMGENIKLARKRRKLRTIQVAERANIRPNNAVLYRKRQAFSFYRGLFQCIARPQLA